jgi:2,4-dienoyl-CoA reductase-like NADH-dependent reductase (Old Yellow Enzyme family)
MACYYARRARHGVGLILTEATIVHPSGDGYRNVPYICDDAHVASWRLVTDAVHLAGGRIFCQLWHCGRISHPDFLGGAQPVSSSSRQAEGINRQNGKPYGVPRRLEATELPAIVAMFRRAATNALRAGFDGVELHLAHGYLPDQFFDARVNDRTDAYGGPVENRCRFPLEITRAVLEECGADKVMARISPVRQLGGLYEWPDLEAMLEYLVPAVDEAGLRMLDVSCAGAEYYPAAGRVVRMIRPRWPHLLISGASLQPADAESEIAQGWIDMVTYGRLLLANPDLVQRVRAGEPLQPYSRDLLATLT